MHLKDLQRKQRENKDNDLALVWLCEELEYAGKGHVIKCNDAWDRHSSVAEKAGITILASFTSRRASFKDKLMHNVGDIVACVQSFAREPYDRLTLLIPKKYAKMALSELVSEGPADEDTLLTMPEHHQTNKDICLALVHVALNIRAVLNEKPGFNVFQSMR